MGWKNLGEKPVVDTPWFRLNMADVELPGGRRRIYYEMARADGAHELRTAPR